MNVLVVLMGWIVDTVDLFDASVYCANSGDG